MSALRPLTRAEVLKLHSTRTTRLSILAALAFAALLGFANATLAGQDTNPDLGSPAWVRNVLAVSTIPPVVALVLGVLLAAGEYQHRTITTTFLVTPRRFRVVAAKVLAAVVAGPVVAVAMMAVSAATTVPFVLAEGATVDALHRGTGRAVAGVLLASALLGAIGVLLGMLVRSQVASVVLVTAWALVLEGVVDVLAGGGLGPWLPGVAAADLAGGGRTVWVAALVLLAWAAVAAAVTLPAVARRDVA